MNKETKLVKNQIRNPQITSQILHQKQKSSPQLTLNMPINRRFTLSFTPKNQLQETTIQSPRTQEKQKDNFFGSPSLSVQKNNSTSNLFSNCKDDKIITLNKFYSFKKIRQLKTKQKNDQGKVISQIRIDSQNIRISPQVKMDQIKKKPNLKQRITDLNEARTISSNYSPRSSNHSGMIVESQIICKGHQVFYDFDEGEAFNKNFQLGQFGFKRRNNIEKVRHPQLDLLISKQLGWLCHYQIQEQPIDKDTIELLRIVDEKQANTWHFNQGILSLYAQHPIKNQEQQFFYRQKNRKPLNAKKKYLLIYQPYEMEFQKFIRKCENLYFCDIIKFLGQLINQLRFIRDRTRSANISVAPIVRMEYLVISADRVKIKIQKLRMVCPQSSCISQFVKNSYGSPFVQKHSRASSYYENSFQKQVLKDIGMVGYQIVNCLRVDHQKRSYNIRQLSRQTKIRFNNLMQDLISGDCDYALEEALSKMQILMGP